MFKLLDSICGPIRFKKNPSHKLKSGSIVSLDENFTLIPCQDNKKPLGILGNKARKIDMHEVWVDSCQAVTDQFESQQKYEPQMPLYVCNGCLTSQKPIEETYLVGYVVSPPDADSPSLIFDWI